MAACQLQGCSLEDCSISYVVLDGRLLVNILSDKELALYLTPPADIQSNPFTYSTTVLNPSEIAFIIVFSFDSYHGFF